MNICTKQHNISKIILEYVALLIKCEQLHNKLEKLCLNTATNTKQLIIKINNKLNIVLVELMKRQWIIELFETLHQF